MPNYRYIFILFLSISSVYLKAQTSVGSWNDYLSYNNVHCLAENSKYIFAASEIGMFSYDKEEYYITEYTKSKGLHDVSISTIATIPNSDDLLIAYANGNFDILNSDGSISNIPDLKMKSLSYSKEINDIYFFDNKAYCSTDFGILVLDYRNEEIYDTYYIGDESLNMKVNEISIHNDTIYAATENGILAAPKNSNSLNYYKTWELVSNNTKEYLSIEIFKDQLIAVMKNSNKGDIFILNDNSLSLWQSTSNFIKIKSIGSKLAIISSNKILIYNDLQSDADFIAEYDTENNKYSPSFSDIIFDNNVNIYLGDTKNGLFKKSEIFDTKLTPDGPASNESLKVVATSNSLWSVPGNYHLFDPVWRKGECSILSDGDWIIYNESTDTIKTNSKTILIKNTRNFNDIAIDPTNKNHVFISSAHSGILEFLNNELINQYDQTNSSIENVGSVKISNGLVFDNEGNLFINNLCPIAPIKIKPYLIEDNSEENNFGWFINNYETYGTDDSTPWLRQSIYTKWGHIWCVSAHNPKGLFVYSTDGTIDNDSDDAYRYAGNVNSSGNAKLLIWDENGTEIKTSPLSLVEDQNGYIWMGTNTGIFVYYRPHQIFETDKPIASRIKIPRNDGSGLADYLLENESINTIAVDGANRKWIGTNNGVYLISQDGSSTLLKFNIDNSPLISNIINSIAINPETGEVFIATNKGIQSYKGTATQGEESFNNIYAFPNPVQPGYQGIITIKGLIEDSSVRITDISGKLVFQAISTGGQMVWNGKNVYNERVKSGVYLVFATNEDGSESMVTKIMVIK